MTHSPKLTHYSPDGFGRDTYILSNHAGLHKELLPPRNGIQSYKLRDYSPPSPHLRAKPLKYRPDGTGRDVYVIVDHGGLFNRNQQTNFYKSLRSQSPRYKTDRFLQTTMGFMPNYEQRKSKRVKTLQEKHVRRLSEPRKTMLPEIKRKEVGPRRPIVA